jgi:aminopeptidase-like protein
VSAARTAWLEACVNLQRSLVSEGFETTLAAVEAQAGGGFVRHAFPCGSEAFTWIVPPRWVVRAARIAADGVTLVDAAQHPLHLVTHSAPFSGRVSRDELLTHLHTDPARPDVIPYVYRFYAPLWGFCIPHSWLDRFTADQYDVTVDTELQADGNLVIGELTLAGRSPRTIVLSAHLDHPGQFEDGLCGVAALLDLAARRRARAATPFFTLTFLFTCETLGALCYLSRFESQVRAKVEGCIAPEALCNGNRLMYGRSFGGDTQLDRAAGCVFRRRFGDGDGLPFAELLSNDDQVFDGPGFLIPSLSIARWPYDEYHTHLDGLNLFDAARFDQSCDVIDEILGLLDRNVAPRPRYQNIPFFTRFGLWQDWFGDAALRRNLERLLRLLDGRHSLVDLAHLSGLPIDLTEDLLEKMAAADLVSLDGDPVPIDRPSRQSAPV